MDVGWVPAIVVSFQAKEILVVGEVVALGGGS